jgi:fatty-acyl-CoA synthase
MTFQGPELPLRRETIYEAFAAVARKFPDRLALVARPDDVRWTYRELLDEVEKTARGLAAIGLQSGDRVGVWAGSCAEWILLQLACPRLGVVLVSVNPAYRAAELGYILRKSKMAAIFHFPNCPRADYDAILREACSGEACNGASQLRHDIRIGTESWQAMIAAGADTELTTAPIDPHDVVNLQYTSGTTGNPKGVQLTHHNLVNNAQLTARGLGITERDRVCQTFPLYHCAGYTVTSLGALLSGAAFVLPSRMFDPRATLETIEQEKITMLLAVPSMYLALLEQPDFDRIDVTSVRVLLTGGAACSSELIQRLEQKFGTREIHNAYGQTESSPTVTMCDQESSAEQRATTIGRTMPNTEIKIADVGTGDPVPLGEQGEVCARGYFTMKGYDDDPEATRVAIDAEGWLHTGDLGMMREDGYVVLTGRAKDMIIRGGENISPKEIENLLQTHPKIAEACVLGLPDERLGEIVIAWVRLKDGENSGAEEIREFCCGKAAHFKIPQHIRVVESFPMTASGKVQKFRIREMEKELALQNKSAKTSN